MKNRFYSFRGSSYLNYPNNCRSTSRFNLSRDLTNSLIGFRIIKNGENTMNEQFLKINDFEFATIPSGSFMMGSPDGEGYDDEHPQHEVTFAEPFEMSTTHITQAQWRAVSVLPKIAIELPSDPSYFKGDDLPVESITWYQAIEFCKRLSAHTGDEYDLPSEAQWEYACRAGTTTRYWTGDELTKEQANFDSTCTTPVKKYPPNPFGLHDMHGNVWCMCADTWHGNYVGAPTDGSAWID